VTPLGHLSLAFLAGSILEYDRRMIALCLAGAVVPDLIDKPLVWAGVFDIGHTVGHSVVTLGVITAVVTIISPLRILAPAVLGYATHILADLFVAYPKFLTNYAWPLLPQRPTPDGPVLDYWLAYAGSGPGVVEASVVVLAVGLVIKHSRADQADS
jgi:Predicted membrane-bound metal-dependent hydrolase (DUF457).